MFRVTSASNEDLERVLDAARKSEPTYKDLGATAGSELPPRISP